MNVIRVLDVVVDHLLPSFFQHWGSWEFSAGVSVLGFSVAVVIVCTVINAVLLRA